MTTEEQDDLLERLGTGAGQLDPGLLAQAEGIDADALAARMEQLGGHAGCDLACVLARRHDPRGIAALARAATVLATSYRALGYLTELEMQDMVPPPCREAAWLARAEAVDLLGSEPDLLEQEFHGTVSWPDLGRGQHRRAETWLFRYRFAGLPDGVALLGPARVRVDSGVDQLDADDRLALALGCAFEARLVPLAPDNVPKQLVQSMTGSRAYLYLSEPRLQWAYDLEGDMLLVIAANRPHGRQGFLVGGGYGRMPIQWLEVAGDARRAAWIWLGRMLLADS